MTVTTLAERTLLRTKPQQTQLTLTVFTPHPIFQAQVNNATGTFGDRYIYYNNVTLGNETDVESGMTLLVGTIPGAQDIGRIRVRGATAAYLLVSENSNISWANNLYLTVLKYWEVWPIFPRIIKDPSDDLKVIFYKDYDIAYTNQNSVLGSFINMGPHRSGFTGDSLYWDAAGTFNLKGDALTYAWKFEGGTPSSSASGTPGNVDYSNPGDYVTKLTVTNASGGTDISYRYVTIRDRIGQGDNPPIQRWEMRDLHGSRGEGLYSATIIIYDQIDIEDNAVVIISSEDWSGDTQTFIGGNDPNNTQVFFVGYVEKDSIKTDYKKNLIEFSVFSITGVMKQAVGFSVSTQSDRSPDTWYKILDLDVRRALYHYLRWHTTVLKVADFEFVGTDRDIQYFDADRTSIFDAIDNLMRGTLIGSVSADRQGKVFAEVDPQAYTTPLSSFTHIMTITKRDWMNTPVIQERQSGDLSYLEYGGIAYSNVGTGTSTALMACAPGNAPAFRGKIETLEGLALASSSQLRRLVGNVFANRNTRYPTIDMDMSENLRNFDIAPQEVVTIIIDAEDTPKNVEINGAYIPSDFTWKYDATKQILLPTISFTNLVNGDLGESIAISPVAPPGATVPPVNPPTIPPIVFPPFYTAISSYGYVNWDGGTPEQASLDVDITVLEMDSNGGSVQFKVKLAGTYLATLSATNSRIDTIMQITIVCSGHPDIIGISYASSSVSKMMNLHANDVVEMDAGFVYGHLSEYAASIVKLSV